MSTTWKTKWGARRVRKEPPTLEEALIAAEAFAPNAKAEVAAALTVLSQREQNLVKEMEVADGERTKVAADVEPFALSRYERLLNTKGENVVVGVPRGICGGCHMKQTTQVVVEVKGQQDIVTCISCGRILFFTSDMD